MKPFAIFRPGKHVAACGTAVEFTREDLEKAVSSYNAQTYAAPLVIGHPKVEDRAYGWAEKLTIDESGTVYAHPDHVEPKFGELVEAKAYRNRSVSWYMPDHPSNPVPGVLYPKHIGFLGAVPPSLKGLGDAEFSDGTPLDFSTEEHPDKVVQFASGTDDQWALASALSSMARVMRGLREYILADKGAEEADRLVPSWQIDDAQSQAVRVEERARQSSQIGMAYNEPATIDPPTNPEHPTMTPEQIQALKDENERNKTRITELEGEQSTLAAREFAASLIGLRNEVQTHVTAGRVLPRDAEQLASFMASLDDSTESATIEFGEAPEGGTVPKVSPRDFMRKFIAGLPKAVDFNERGSGGEQVTGKVSAKELGTKIADKVAQVQKEQGRTISYSEASQLVVKELNLDTTQA